MAADADIIWNNQKHAALDKRPGEKKDEDKQPKIREERSASRPSTSDSQSRDRRVRLVCDLHGPGSHDTQGCRVLNQAKASGQAPPTRSSERARKPSRAALLTQLLEALQHNSDSSRTAMASGSSSGRPKQDGEVRRNRGAEDGDGRRGRGSNSSGAGFSGRTTCSYCARPDHDASKCLIQYPERASEGWLPREAGLKQLFLANLKEAQAKAKSQEGRKSAAASVKAQEYDEEDEEEDEDDYQSTRSAAHVSYACASAAQSLACGPQISGSGSARPWYDNSDYARAVQQMYDDLQGDHAAAMATLTAQQVPVAFDTREILPDVYPPPRVPPRPKEGNNLEAADFTLRIPMSELCEAVAKNLRHAGQAPTSAQAPEAVRAAQLQDLRKLVRQQDLLLTKILGYADMPLETLLSGRVPPASGQDEEMSDLMERNPKTAEYFRERQLMFYYPLGAITFKGSLGKLVALRDHCANVNLIGHSTAGRLGLRYCSTKTLLSTSAEDNHKRKLHDLLCSTRYHAKKALTTAAAPIKGLARAGAAAIAAAASPLKGTALACAAAVEASMQRTTEVTMEPKDQPPRVGGTHASTVGLDGVSLTSQLLAMGGLLSNAASGSPGLAPVAEQGWRSRGAPSPSFAAALATVESFTFDGKTAVTAYERYIVAAKKCPDTGLWTQHRMAQDYRSVNAHTPQDQYGLHRPEEIFQQVGKAKLFSKLDLRQGFLQIPTSEKDQAKTAFWVGNKLVCYNRMPYGLKNASAKFQRVMDYEISKAKLDHCAISFIDDVLIWSDTQHEKDVATVLDMLHSCGLRAHPDKSIFAADVIEYLGHNLSTFGISPHQAKVAAIMGLQPPKNVSELRTQLGFINYYRCYCPQMSRIASDLNKLLKKDHQPLLYLMSSEGLTGQYARFALALQEYNFTVEHRPGVKHQNADTLSRNPSASTTDNSGARLDEEEDATNAPRGQLLKVSCLSAKHECEAFKADVHAAKAAAPFSEALFPSPEEALQAWNGWGWEQFQPPPDASDEEAAHDRNRLRSSALEWRSARWRALRREA
ncbi:Retrovirus-related Pol polyprotein from transposon [Tetrabaena socialis]|uniref:Retrovirus-related Pol polyprotein from transposon n=1 Tax=Tetrabaena socialis TaxID=47790 RepID=A0A2J7ZLF8_9CHLO|nr:Retrovirus-related Pol polyprotein from transposon [Tetrabaena socialis]|eukprot:PNH01097.1 Retrovirus-related Pol polyprotein from transposon [Tetrabaena socialis]